MQRLSILSLFFLFTMPSWAAEKEIPVKSEIKAVTVFLRGAQVTREATVTLNKGTTVLKFEALSPNIDKNSIQVEGDQKFVILSVNHQANYLKEVSQTVELREIDSQIEDLIFKIQMRKNLETVYAEEKRMLIDNKAIKGSETSLIIEDLMEMADFYRDRMEEVELKLLEIQRDKKKLAKKIKLLQQQRYNLDQNQGKHTSEIIVNLSSKSTTTAKIRVRYIVSNAGWIPSYDVRSDDINGPVEFTYKAKVFQNTGYDWEKVDLKLSTGNPSVSGTKPTVTPHILAIYDPLAEARQRDAERKYKDQAQNEADRKLVATNREIELKDFIDVDEEISVDDLISEDHPQMRPSADGQGYFALEQRAELDVMYEWNSPSVADHTTVAESNVSTTFTIDLPYTIPSDNKKNDVEVARHDLPVEYNYFTAPKVDNDAFLVAQVSGWDSYNLLPGDANIYYEDTYVGTAFLDTRTTSDTLAVSLGRDQGLVITRKKVKEYSKTVTVGSTKKVQLGIEISVRNTKSSQVELTMEDQVPISANKEIQISIDDKGGATLDEATGKLTWKIKVRPGETQTFRFIYTVKHPKGAYIPNF